jgi:hypothetical protein
MLSALILVCSLASMPDLASCTEANATQVIRDPEVFVSPVTCYVHGQAYVAQTALAPDLGEGERVKVVCARKRTTSGPSPEAATSSALAR